MPCGYLPRDNNPYRRSKRAYARIEEPRSFAAGFLFPQPARSKKPHENTNSFCAHNYNAIPKRRGRTINVRSDAVPRTTLRHSRRRREGDGRGGHVGEDDLLKA
jgi:hypothetical protein